MRESPQWFRGHCWVPECHLQPSAQSTNTLVQLITNAIQLIWFGGELGVPGGSCLCRLGQGVGPAGDVQFCPSSGGSEGQLCTSSTSTGLSSPQQTQPAQKYVGVFMEQKEFPTVFAQESPCCTMENQCTLSPSKGKRQVPRLSKNPDFSFPSLHISLSLVYGYNYTVSTLKEAVWVWIQQQLIHLSQYLNNRTQEIF